MLSTVARLFSKASVMGALKSAALEAAKKFPLENTRNFFTRWSNHVYEEGISIEDDKKFQEYVKTVKADIAAIQRQSTIQNMYVDVE